MQNENPAPNPLDNTTPTPTPTPSSPPNDGTEAAPQPVTTPEAPPPLTRESFKLPDGAQIDATQLDEFVGIMNNADHTPVARAQALVDLQAKVMQAASERASQAFIDQNNAWQEEVRKDAVIGGEKLDPALGRISELINTYPNAMELRQALDLTGAGNNPHVIKFLHQVASRLAEGTPAPAAAPTPAQSEQAKAERLFPTMRS